MVPQNGGSARSEQIQSSDKKKLSCFHERGFCNAQKSAYQAGLTVAGKCGQPSPTFDEFFSKRTQHHHKQAKTQNRKLLTRKHIRPKVMLAHNLKVVGSNPAPANNLKPSEFPMSSGVFWWSGLLVNSDSNLTKIGPALFCAWNYYPQISA